ncbi:gluconate 5-dehydrogenase [Yersinia pestis]
MGVFTASLRSACSLRRGHFVNNLRAPIRCPKYFVFQHIKAELAASLA